MPGSSPCRRRYKWSPGSIPDLLFPVYHRRCDRALPRHTLVGFQMRTKDPTPQGYRTHHSPARLKLTHYPNQTTPRNRGKLTGEPDKPPTPTLRRARDRPWSTLGTQPRTSLAQPGIDHGDRPWTDRGSTVDRPWIDRGSTVDRPWRSTVDRPWRSTVDRPWRSTVEIDPGDRPWRPTMGRASNHEPGEELRGQCEYWGTAGGSGPSPRVTMSRHSWPTLPPRSADPAGTDPARTYQPGLIPVGEQSLSGRILRTGNSGTPGLETHADQRLSPRGEAARPGRADGGPLAVL